MSRFFSQDVCNRSTDPVMISDKLLPGVPAESCRSGCCARTGGSPEGAEARGINRRRFIRLSGMAASVFAALGLSEIVRAYLSVGPVQTAPVRFVVGTPSDFPPGSVTPREGIFVLRDAAGLFALNAACPHLGCRIQWKAGDAVFECPCHGSRYDHLGGYLSGPARKPLTPVYLTRNDAGQLVADLSKRARPENRIGEG